MTKAHGSRTNLVVGPAPSVGPVTDLVRDAWRNIEHAESQCDGLTSEAAGAEFELYHRSSATVSAVRRADTEGVLLHHGSDEGMALRMRAAVGGPVGFAAVTGASDEGLRWCLRRCRDQLHRGGEVATAEWTLPEADGPVLDHEPGARLPSVGETDAWLTRAWEAVRDHAEGRGWRPLEGWIEASTTVETWAAGRWRASRIRMRGWAMVRLLGAGGMSSRPITVARRRWPDLGPRAWVEALGDRWCPTGDPVPVPAPAEKVPVLFDPPSSATLVLALAAALHGRDHTDHLPVGPGWCLEDDPRDAEALFGGLFDDVGFPTRSLPLADGAWSVGHTSVPGCLRRPSFSDRPAPRPSHLSVNGDRGEPPPDRGVLVSGLTIHALGPDLWVVLVEAATLDHGLPGPPIVPALIRVSPRELVRRCSATVGPARQSPQGVRTPALLFEGLALAAV